MPANFFGLDIIGLTDIVTVPFNSYRFWDNGCRWTVDNTSYGVFNFANVDQWITKITALGVRDCLFELGGTPTWASSQPTNTGCDYYGELDAEGYCAPPSDLNSDGTGANQYWRQWCKAAGQHFASYYPSILVSGWSPWNEFSRGASYNGVHSWIGTNAQMVRLAQDARAIILGRGTITATGESAAAAQGTVGLSGPAYPAAGSQMLSPSESFPYDATFITDYFATAGATDAAEIIALHIGAQNISDVQSIFTTFQGLLSATNLAKPLWVTETSWYLGNPSDPATLLKQWYTYLYGQAARMYWYSYGGTYAPLAVGATGVLTPAGVAYEAIFQQLNSSTTTTVPNLDDIVPLGKTDPRWKAPCFLPSCNPGGSGKPTYNSQTTGHASPSLDGASMQFSMTGPPNTNILWVLIAGVNNQATNFTNDFEIWIPTNSKGLVGSYEIDMFLFSSTDKVEYMFGTQWNEASGKWQIWDQQHGHWIDTLATAGFTLGDWTHVQQSAHRIAGDKAHMYFDYVIINGVTHWYSGTPGVSVQQPSGPGYITGECGIQFQVDLWSGGPGGNITYYIDKASFTAAPAAGQTTSVSDSVTFGENLSTQGNNSNAAYIYDNMSASDYLSVNGQGGGQVTNVDQEPTIPPPVFNPVVVLNEGEGE